MQRRAPAPILADLEAALQTVRELRRAVILRERRGRNGNGVSHAGRKSLSRFMWGGQPADCALRDESGFYRCGFALGPERRGLALAQAFHGGQVAAAAREFGLAYESVLDFSSNSERPRSDGFRSRMGAMGCRDHPLSGA